MKKIVDFHIYCWHDSYEIHVFPEDSRYVVVHFGDNSSDPKVWEIQHIDYDNNYTCVFERLTELSEEDSFQKSVAWDVPIDYFLVIEIQKYIDNNLPNWGKDKTIRVSLEY